MVSYMITYIYIYIYIYSYHTLYPAHWCGKVEKWRPPVLLCCPLRAHGLCQASVVRAIR